MKPLFSPRRSRRPATRQTRRSRPELEVLEDRCLLSASPSTASAAAAYGQLPLAFEVNEGQAAAGVNYVAHGSGYALDLSSQQAVLNLSGPSAAGTPLTMQLGGANAAAPAVGSNELITRSNYLTRNDPSQWLTNIANYGAVTYQGVYQGTDVSYHGNQGSLEYDFNVHPGASVGAIQLAFQGQQGLSLDGQGNLVIQTAAGPLVEQAPMAYQVNADGSHTAVTSSYVLEGNGQVGFQVGPYDHGQTLVIDPTLSYSSYLDRIWGVAVDSAGDAYLAGDNSISKMNPTGTALIYNTTVGGGGGIGIAVDAAGDAYVIGQNPNVPTTSNAIASSASGNFFVAQVNPTGSGLVYATYLPGAVGYAATAGEPGSIAVDGSGDIYVAGAAQAGLPVTAGAFQATCQGFTNAFFAKINPALSGTASLVYSTYLGGSGSDAATGLAVDGSGNAYLTGYTGSTNFPTTSGAPQRTYGGGSLDAFVAKISPALSGSTSLVYSTYLGGSGQDGYYSYQTGLFGGPGDSPQTDGGIAVDAAGNAYVTSVTTSTDFPTTKGAFNASSNLKWLKGKADDPPSAAFVTKLNPTGTALVYSTYLGGGTNTFSGGAAIAVDPSGDAHVTGWTNSSVFPTKNALQAQNAGGYDAFVTVFNPTGSGLLFSSYFGGSGGAPGVGEAGFGIALDPAGNAYVGGLTSSTNFPTTPGAYQTTPGSGFVLKIDPPAEGGSTPAVTAAGPSSPPLPPASASTPPSAPAASSSPGKTALDELFTAYLDAWLLQAFDRLLADQQNG
jgi:hypothetical protein